ncbi:MAG: hypothetical protein CW691_08925 [Candidatus Bathyarchaeum sp.]|nr:MAG: hypothetical protein CW691_08925 [Candidatus Bathyarchaeum sp.]
MNHKKRALTSFILIFALVTQIAAVAADTTAASIPCEIQVTPSEIGLLNGDSGIAETSSFTLTLHGTATTVSLPTVVLTTESYIVNEGSWNINPSTIDVIDGKHKMTWYAVHYSSLVGDFDFAFEDGETAVFSFQFNSAQSGTLLNVLDEAESYIQLPSTLISPQVTVTGYPIPSEPNLSVTTSVSPTTITVDDESTADPEEMAVTITVDGYGGTTQTRRPIHAVLVIDKSVSMGYPDVDPTGLRLDAAKNFLDMLDPTKDKVALVAFSDPHYTVSYPESEQFMPYLLTDDFDEVKENIGAIVNEGSTYINTGLALSLNYLHWDTDPDALKMVIFMSDGDGVYTESSDPNSLTNVAASAGYKIHTISLSDDRDDSLQDMAYVTGGKYTLVVDDDFNSAFTELFDYVIDRTSPGYIDVLAVTMPYILNEGTFNIMPNDFDEISGYTVISWNDIAPYSGKDGDHYLGADESVKIKFTATCNTVGTNLDILVVSGGSEVSYANTQAQRVSVPMPRVTINVQELPNVAPTAAIIGPYKDIEEGELLFFDGSGSTDSDGTIVSYDWSFGDGNTAASVTADHAYADDGVYIVTLAVTDDDGATDTTTHEIAVSNVAPLADAGEDKKLAEGSTVSFVGSASDAGVADILTISWDFGDGNSDTTGTLNPTHVYADDGDYLGTLTVADDDGESATDTLMVTVTNVAPVVDAGADQTLDEGDAVNFNGVASDPGTSDTLTVSWDFGDGTADTIGTLSPTHVYYNEGTYIVTLTVTDDDGGIGTDTLAVTVLNVAPTATLSNNGPVEEGSPVTVSFIDQYDPGSDVFTYSFDWNNDGAYDIVDQTAAVAQYTWYDNGYYTVNGIIKDEDGTSTESTTVVTVVNVAPTAELRNSGPVSEGGSVTVYFSGEYDPGTDIFTYSFDWDNDGVYDVVDQVTASAQSTFMTAGVYTVTAKIADDDGGFTEYTTDVIVETVEPIGCSLVVSPDLVQVEETVTGAATFVNLVASNVYVAEWDWGDGTIETGALTDNTVIGLHVYSEAGVYTVSITLTDGTSSVTQTYQYVVVYDPDGGFVTGGGWIDSPEGAYSVDPSLSGRATFGFVSKYKKGATVPTGNTEFIFHTAGLNFHSSSYDWLVIAGAKAKYKGVGAINGEGEYKFMITATDGDLTGSDDTFRMKIWTEDEYGVEHVIYDNQIGDITEGTALSSGNIVVHKPK